MFETDRLLAGCNVQRPLTPEAYKTCPESHIEMSVDTSTKLDNPWIFI